MTPDIETLIERLRAVYMRLDTHRTLIGGPDEYMDAVSDAMDALRAVEWRPISEAPKDGTPVIVARYVEPFGWIRGWATYHNLSRIGAGWIARGFGVFGEMGLGEPTHYWPIPPLHTPRASKEG